MNIPYDTAKGLIKEADVLLFRAGKFPGIGWWISSYTKSPYSHAGLAHWDDGKLYCVEFREFKGSRKYKMDDYIAEGAQIDVFRSVETYVHPIIQQDEFDDEYYVSYHEHRFTADIALAITAEGLKHVGEGYGWRNIWQMGMTYIPFLRLGRKVIKNGEPDPKSFVCSTLVTYAYRKHYIDPVPFLSDKMTSPGDLARSGLFSRLFSIKS